MPGMEERRKKGTKKGTDAVARETDGCFQTGVYNGCCVNRVIENSKALNTQTFTLYMMTLN
jgi:hypothetical protein